MVKGPLFLNTPIDSPDRDVVGVGSYVDRLDAAIDRGAQLIGIVAPSGAGKSSLTELLERRRTARQGDGAPQEQFFRVPMGGRLSSEEEGSGEERLSRTETVSVTAAELHRIFLRQLADCVAPQGSARGGRRTSARKAPKGKTQERDEDLEFYRAQVLRPRRVRWEWEKRSHPEKRYIAVVEDLDKTDAPEAVLQFLTELYKYCVLEKDVGLYENRFVFLVNIEPESALLPERWLRRGEPLYPRIFDFILDLQAVNTDNYDAILNALLGEHRDEMKALGIDTDGVFDLSRLPGMQWIVRGRRLGLREIKERLNLAFSRLESLQERFPGTEFSFERCAAAAYLLTAFEEEFYRTDDRAFQELVDHCAASPAELSYADGEEACREALPGTGAAYREAVWDLIQARLIDASYRVYFYNCPKNSRLYSAHESAVMGAILYGEEIPGLPELVDELTKQGSPVVTECYQKLRQLGIPLPKFALEIEPLYTAAVACWFDGVLRRLSALDYSQGSVERDLSLFRSLLSYDRDRKVYGAEHAEKLCELWDREMSEPALLRLRGMLCQDFPQEIGWYRSLFSSPHKHITTEEMDRLPLPSAVALLDWSGGRASRREADYVVRRWSGLEAPEREELTGEVEQALRGALALLGIEKMAVPLLNFMGTAVRSIPDFERALTDHIGGMEEGEEKQSLFDAYQRFVDRLAPRGLSAETARQIGGLGRYEGYAPETAKAMRDAGFALDFVLLSLYQGREIPYGEDDVLDGIRANGPWLLENHWELFRWMRLDLVSSRPDVLERYAFLFGEGYPALTAQEIETLGSAAGDVERLVMELLPPGRADPETAGALPALFSRQEQSGLITQEILRYVGMMEKGTAQRTFYALDFDAVRYRGLTEAQRAAARGELNGALELEQTENRLKFMRATRCMEPSWEAALALELKDDPALKRAYIDTVNHCEEISQDTVPIVTGLGAIYGMAPQVTEEIFQSGQYPWYVTSKIQWDKRFEMEEGERGEALWETYLDIFGRKSRKRWGRIQALMQEDGRFLRKIMEREAYRGFTDEGRMSLSGVPQDAASIRECAERGGEFALAYLTQIEGFRDGAAAEAFVELVCSDPALLASDALYEHTCGLLPGRTLRSRYADRRRRK